MNRQYRLKYFNGYFNKEKYVHADSYDHACTLFGVAVFPASYIWGIEPFPPILVPDEPKASDWVKGWDNIDKCNTNRRKIRDIVPKLLNTMHEQEDSRILEKFYNDLDNLLTKWKQQP